MSIFRKPGERPYYPPEPPKPKRPTLKEQIQKEMDKRQKAEAKRLTSTLFKLPQQRSQYWRPKFQWPNIGLIEIWFGFILVFIGCVVGYNIYNPCVRHGPEKTYYAVESCGDNCWINVPHTYRECLEREKK